MSASEAPIVKIGDMGIRNGPIDRARRRIDDDLRRVRLDLGRGRRASGLSLDTIGRACDVSASTVQRIETGAIRDPRLRTLASMAASVGLELRLQAFPAGDPIRDVGQQRLLGRLRGEIEQALTWRTEVVLAGDRDRRAWDATIGGIGWRIAIDAETVLDDLQAVERRVALKQRDSGVRHVILLISDTRRNRRALRAAPDAFAGYSRDARAALRALRLGEDPGTDTIILL